MLLHRVMRERRSLLLLAAIVASAAIAYAVVSGRKHAPKLPNYQIARSEFLDVLEFRGELKARSSLTLSAPADAGDLQIIKIVADGAQVKKGDVIVQFDGSKLRQTLAEKQSGLKSARAEIEAEKAKGTLAQEKDQTDLSKSRFDADSARLDASKGEILSHIEGAEAELKYSDAKQAVAQAQEKLRSDQVKAQATLQGKDFARTKAQFDVSRTSHALSGMELLAPRDGTVSLISVWHGMGEAPFKAGERAWPGSPIAELPDASTIEINARVDETERGRIRLQQPVTAQLDALADRQFAGRIVQISTIATSDFSAGWPVPRNFNLQIALDHPDPQMRPGMTAQVTVIVNRVPDSIVIPAQATFEDAGQTIAWVWNGRAFMKHPIQVQRRSRDRVLISHGLDAGDVVALTDPTVKE